VSRPPSGRGTSRAYQSQDARDVAGFRYAPNPKLSPESVIRPSRRRELRLVAAPAIVCRGIALADHRTQPPPAPSWDHHEFPSPPCDERLEAGAGLRNTALGRAAWAWPRRIVARMRDRHSAGLTCGSTAGVTRGRRIRPTGGRHTHVGILRVWPRHCAALRRELWRLAPFGGHALHAFA
jgi:hypothetical protein